jgi:glycine oxidase
MFDVVVIGAGAVGLSIARRVAGHGGSILVLDADSAGGRGSRAAAGVAIPSVRLLQDRQLHEFATAGAVRLEEDVKSLEEGQPLRRGRGVLRLVEQLEQREAFEQAADDAGFDPGRWLQPGELTEAEPLLSGGKFVGGYEGPDGYLVDTDAYLDAMLRDALGQGVEIGLGETVLSVGEVSGGTTVATDKREVSCEQLVLAAGAWSGVIPGLPRLPVKPLRGQMVTMQQAGAKLDRIISGRAYLAPWRGSEIVLGASEEDVGFAEENTPAGMTFLFASLMRMAPGLRGARLVRSWAGLRSSTPDGRPLLGRIPEAPGVLAATGHGGQGILTAALTGDAVAEILASGTSFLGESFALASGATG